MGDMAKNNDKTTTPRNVAKQELGRIEAANESATSDLLPEITPVRTALKDRWEEPYGHMGQNPMMNTFNKTKPSIAIIKNTAT